MIFDEIRKKHVFKTNQKSTVVSAIQTGYLGIYDLFMYKCLLLHKLYIVSVILLEIVLISTVSIRRLNYLA